VSATIEARRRFLETVPAIAAYVNVLVNFLNLKLSVA